MDAAMDNAVTQWQIHMGLGSAVIVNRYKYYIFMFRRLALMECSFPCISLIRPPYMGDGDDRLPPVKRPEKYFERTTTPV